MGSMLVRGKPITLCSAFNLMLGISLVARPEPRKDVKSCTYCCYVKCTTNRGNSLASNRRNSLPCKVLTSSLAIKGLVVWHDMDLWFMGRLLGQAQRTQYGPLVLSRWLSSSSAATPHRYISHILHHILCFCMSTYFWLDISLDICFI